METDNAVTELAPRIAHRTSLIADFADKYGIEPAKMLETLKQTCFRTPPDRPISNEQMAALLLVCKANDLNPFVRMVYALLDKGGVVIPYIGYDGWVSLVNRQPQMSGVEQEWSADGAECITTMWRKDWSHPCRTTAYLSEAKRGTTPWSTQPKNMLEIRSYVKCARRTFGFPGLHDEYSAREIARGDTATLDVMPAITSMEAVKAATPPSKGKHADIAPPVVSPGLPDVTDMLRQITQARTFEELEAADQAVGQFPSDHPDRLVLIEALRAQEHRLAPPQDDLPGDN